MADTTQTTLLKVTEELRKATEASRESNRALNRLGEETSTSLTAVGALVKGGDSAIRNGLMKIPGANVAKIAKDFAVAKMQRKKENEILAKRLGITSKQLNLQVAEQEIIRSKQAEFKALKDAAAALGFNSDRIREQNDEGVAQLSGSIRELGSGEFVSQQNASSEAMLRALQTFPVEAPATRSEDFSPADEISIDSTASEILKSLASENTLLSVGRELQNMISAPDVGMNISGASASEDATEQRILADKTLSEQEKQTALLELIAGNSTGNGEEEEKSGGFLSKMALVLSRIGPAVAGIGTSIAAFSAMALAKVKGLGSSVAGGARRGAGGAARGAGGIAKKVGKGLLKAAKFIPGVGLAVTAISGLFDGITAGMREAENENATGLTIAREATAGVLSGLTFGLIDQETISAGMTGIADGVLGIGASVSTKLSEIGASATEKFNEAKDSAIALGLSVKDKITNIPIPTFAEASESLYNFSTGFASAIGIPVPTFDDAKASLTEMGTKLTAGFTSLFGEEDGSFSFASVSKGVTGLAGEYFDKIGNIWNDISDLFPSMDKIKDMLPSPSGILSSLTGGLLGSDDEEDFDPTNYVTKSDVKTIVAAAVTKALKEQSMINRTSAANAPFMFMQGAQNSVTTISTTKPLFMPVTVSTNNDSGFNKMND
tara:strand:+ start:43 stop:2037 length:1995 start_codon:yes stop_codon:yes gene_type:complete